MASGVRWLSERGLNVTKATTEMALAQAALDSLMDEVFRDLPEDGLSQEETYRREAEAALAAVAVLRTRRGA